MLADDIFLSSKSEEREPGPAPLRPPRPGPAPPHRAAKWRPRTCRAPPCLLAVLGRLRPQPELRMVGCSAVAKATAPPSAPIGREACGGSDWRRPGGGGTGAWPLTEMASSCGGGAPARGEGAAARPWQRRECLPSRGAPRRPRAVGAVCEGSSPCRVGLPRAASQVPTGTVSCWERLRPRGGAAPAPALLPAEGRACRFSGWLLPHGPKFLAYGAQEQLWGGKPPGARVGNSLRVRLARQKKKK